MRPWMTVENNCIRFGEDRLVWDPNGRDIAYVLPNESDNGNGTVRLSAAAPFVLSMLKDISPRPVVTRREGNDSRCPLGPVERGPIGLTGASDRHSLKTPVFTRRRIFDARI